MARNSFYNEAYSASILLLNKPFEDMRLVPETTIQAAIKTVRTIFYKREWRVSEEECDRLLTELLALQTEAKKSRSGKFAKSSSAWQWPKKPEPKEVYLSHHAVRDD